MYVPRYLNEPPPPYDDPTDDTFRKAQMEEIESLPDVEEIKLPELNVINYETFEPDISVVKDDNSKL